jgi:hypothetical protein
MVVLCDGMVRSGSTWSYNVVVNLLRAADSRRVFGLYSEAPTVLAAAVHPRDSHLVIKSHDLGPYAQDLCLHGKIRTVYTWRDPYDALVSCTRMFGRTVDHWLEVMRGALRVWAFHRRTNTAHIVSYAQMMAQPQEEIELIAAYLGLTVTAEQIAAVARKLSFRQVRVFTEHLHELPGQRLVRTPDDVYDRETLLHSHHIRNGGTGYGIRSLRDQDRDALEAVLRDEGFEFLCRQSAGEVRLLPCVATQTAQ